MTFSSAMLQHKPSKTAFTKGAAAGKLSEELHSRNCGFIHLCRRGASPSRVPVSLKPVVYVGMLVRYHLRIFLAVSSGNLAQSSMPLFSSRASGL